MRDETDYELSRAVGVRAVGYVKELRTPPTPDTYALLYHHAAGYNHALSSAVQDAIRAGGGLPRQHAARLYEAHLSPRKHLAPLRRTLVARAADTTGALHTAERRTRGYHASLRAAGDKLAASQTSADAGLIVRGLLAASHAISDEHRELERQLADSLQELDELKERITTIRRESESDPLTRLPGRQHFRQSAVQGLARARRESEPLSLIIVDIDSFRSYNEVQGHHIGDKILRLVGDLIRATAPSQCTVARYSGDQFAVLLPDTTLEQAVKTAERIRASAQGMNFIRKASGRSVGRITVSAGVVLAGFGESADALIERAQDCLSTAKRLGRNRVRSAAIADDLPAEG